MVNKNIIMQIYKITNLINNKIYIGKDTISDPNYFGSGLLINRAFEKYGKDNFVKEVIDETDGYNELSEKEIYWIEQYNSTYREIGYNISKGGDGGDTLSNHPDLDLIRERISKNNPKTGKTYEEAFGKDKADEYKEKLKNNIHKNILSIEVKQKQKEKWIEYNKNFKNRCEFIKSEIDLGRLNEYKDELKIIKKRVSHNFLRNAEGFYNFFGENLRYIFGKLKINRDGEFQKISNWVKSSDIKSIINYMSKIPNRFFSNRGEFYRFIGQDVELKIIEYFKNKRCLINRENVKNLQIKILIDNTQYDSISEAANILNIDRSLIRSRLKSSHFKNYLFKDNDLNIKYNKFIEIDPHLSKKERISIKGKEYESITEASKILNKTNDYITWRLNSKSYPDCIYLNKEVELKETGEPKMKRVSILGKEYESISKAVDGSGIDRQIMRYRLKSNNYPDYFYI